MEKVINRLIIITLAAAILFGAIAFHYRDAEHDSIFREELTFPMYEYLDISLLKLPIIISPYDGNKISVSYAGDLPLEFTEGDNSLKITESDRFVISLFTGDSAQYGLRVYLPQGLYRNISVYSGTGDIKVGRIDCNSLTVTTGSGNILCDDLISLGRFTTTSGSIFVNYDEIVPSTEVFSRRGNVSLDFPKNSSVSVEFETQTGSCVTDLWDGAVTGSYTYSFNGGRHKIKATLEKGTLTIKEKSK